MTTPRLTNPRLKVVMDDGSEHDLQTLNVDLVAFDRERARHKDWPNGQDGPMFWTCYLAWHVMVRRDLIPRMTLAEFEIRCLQATMRDDDEEGTPGESDVGPTRTVAVPDSSSD
jgi:hypothetical protein